MGDTLQAAVWMGPGFMVRLNVGRALWDDKSWSLVALDGPYHIVGLALMAVVLMLL